MLVYLEEADVKRLVQALAERFPGAELAATRTRRWWCAFIRGRRLCLGHTGG